MRRLVLLITALVSVAVVASCKDDGRTLRDPGPGQDLTISTTSIPIIDTGEPDIGDIPLEDLDSLLNTVTLPGGGPVMIAPWRDGAEFDTRSTCESDNVSPALSWSPAPEGTAEIAITLEDLDAPAFTHWVIAGLEPQTIALAEDTVPVGAVEALNGIGDLGYTGPCPPSGSTHTYVLTVHYLGDRSGLEDGGDAIDMINRIEEIELATAHVSGTFSRP